ncbi:PREDICTED: uncharacterized protein LOC108555360 [Eufriesea mexicana]|uniref:uncharacterized protein LOC108555360 n=1 Tax=Eufriesea mexicana TaxID=516756 RepID=UPI00083C220B|nr:PREDICTED: uncharacterized protein LOC108555360 [Eufriesea mexicana]
MARNLINTLRLVRFKYDARLQNLIDIAWIALLCYQESKRRCCAPTFSPISSLIGNQLQGNHYHTIRPQTGCCSLRKCKYARSQAEPEFSNIHTLLERIRYLKQNIRDLESSSKAAHQQFKRDVEKRTVHCQTQESKGSDANNVREILNNCITEMTKLRAILDDENCWWKMFKKREFDCCEQKLPHLHGFLNGNMVTLKILEEKGEPDQDFPTSTLAKSRSKTNIDSGSTSSKRRYRGQDVDNIEDGPKEYINSTIDPRRSIEFSGVEIDDSYKVQCPAPRKLHPDDSPAAGSSGAPKQDEDQREPDLEGSQRAEDETSDEMDTTIEARLSRSEWFAKSSTDLGRVRPSVTFSSENMARKSIIAADISTSMDLLPGVQYKSMRPSMKGLKDLMEKNLSPSQRRSLPKSPKSKEHDRVIIIARCPAPSYDEGLRMGTKTILVVREWATIRIPPSSSISSFECECSTDTDDS